MFVNVPIPNKDYKVLIRCATYNHSKYICDALNGFSIQETDFPFICIVVDDASKDENQEVIRQYANDNCDMSKAEILEDDISKYIRVPHKTNENCVFLFCLLKLNLYGKPEKKEIYKPYREICEYEAICEGDDYWTHPKKIQKQVDWMDNHIDFSMSHTAFDYFYENENRFIPCDLEKLKKIPDPSLEDIISRYHIQSHTVVLRTSALIQAELHDPFLFSGYFLFGDRILFFMMRYYGKIHLMEDNTGVYRKNDGSVTRNGAKSTIALFRSAAEFHCYVCEKYSLSKEFYLTKKKNLSEKMRLYYFFDPSFESKICGRYNPSFVDKLLMLSGMGSFFISLKYNLFKKLGPIYRRFKNKY